MKQYLNNAELSTLDDWIARSIFVEVIRSFFPEKLETIESNSGTFPRSTTSLVVYFEKISQDWNINDDFFLPTAEVSKILNRLDSELLASCKYPMTTKSGISEIILLSPGIAIALVMHMAGYEVKNFAVKMQSLDKIGIEVDTSIIERFPEFADDIVEKASEYISLVQGARPRDQSTANTIN